MIPVHIAFIPVLIPPLLLVFNHLKLDRRLVACLLTFGLVGTYMLVPVGFGAIFLNDILGHNINTFGKPYGFEITYDQIPAAMAIPVSGMFVGLLVAMFISYRKPRLYRDIHVEQQQSISAELGVEQNQQSHKLLNLLSGWQRLLSLQPCSTALFRFDDSCRSGRCSNLKLCRNL